ncbi:MAG: alpha/beta hydrolase, partial [Candidatus Puniceispirillaceae bacterium]
MRGVAAKIIICVAMVLGALWIFGPREPATLQIDYRRIAIPDDVDAYLSIAEARFDDIVPGTHKRVSWFGIPGEKTPVAIVYIHGFSASSEELRPVPDLVAEALGANLYFTRLTGHGRGSAAMAGADVASWMQDVGEAMAIGRSIGDRVLVISTSTGATLAAAAALDDATMENVGGFIFVSPNFGINSRAASLLTWPFARQWLPLIVGDSRNSEPRNMLHARYWTT